MLFNDTTLQRFWAKVNKTDSCWLWTAKTTFGYGYFQINYKYHRAHRVAYQILVGEIPEGLVLDHLCRVRNCVNPEHLEPVTRHENNRRGIHPPLKTHCKYGHEFTPENTRTYYPNGWLSRQCRICAKRRIDEYKLRHQRRL